MSYMNLEYGPVCHECFVAQWLEHPTSVRKVIHRFDSCQGIRFFLCPVHVTCWSQHFSKNTVNPPLSPPGAYSFLTHLRGDLIEMGGLFNLEKTMVSVLHKELEYKVEKLKYKKLARSCSRRTKTNLNFQLPNKPSQISPHEVSLSWLMNTVYHLLVKNI